MAVQYPEAKDCLKLLNSLFQVINANKGPARIEQQWYAHNLANKFANHCFFAIYLSYNRNQLQLSGKLFELSGLPSIEILTRAAIEAFLTFHYIFYSPVNDEERDYKYWAYRLAGHSERKNMPIISPESKQKFAEDNKAIMDFSAKLASNSYFNCLTSRQRKKILKGDWRLPSWKDIALDANLSKMIALYYGHLCGSAHSSSLSVLQMAQAHQKQEQHVLIVPSIYTVNIVCSNFIKEYCTIFPKCRILLDNDDNKLIAFWIHLGKASNQFELSE